MIDQRIEELAKTAVIARFDMRDEVLHKELEHLIAMVSRDEYAKADGRLNVRIRLICERDLQERANLAWSALRKAHQEEDGTYSQYLKAELTRMVESFVREGTLRLIGQLRDRSEDIIEVFSGGDAIDARWMARQRRSAIERLGQSIEDYVKELPRTRVANIIRR